MTKYVCSGQQENVLSQQQEEDSVQYLLGMEEMPFGVSKPTVQKTAFHDGVQKRLVCLLFICSTQKKESREKVVSESVWQGNLN